MDSQKPLDFNASAGEYFVLTIVSLLLAYIPFFGWAYLLNYSSGWVANHLTVNGKKVAYKAGYGESLGFVAINFLLVLVTFGIYTFWFAPKAYRYICNHMYYTDAVPASNPVAAPIAAPDAAQPPANPVG